MTWLSSEIATDLITEPVGKLSRQVAVSTSHSLIVPSPLLEAMV
jgi:hypothetical protein